MGVVRMHHVGVVVEDLDAAKAFFLAIGLESEGDWEMADAWVGDVIGVEGARSRCSMLRTPDGHARLELAQFLAPPAPTVAPDAPSHAPGLRHIAFPVDDLAATLVEVRRLGFDTIGTVARSDPWTLCYVRGPEGIIVELAEEHPPAS